MRQGPVLSATVRDSRGPYEDQSIVQYTLVVVKIMYDAETEQRTGVAGIGRGEDFPLGRFLAPNDLTILYMTRTRT